MVMSSQKPAFRDHCTGGVLELIHGTTSTLEYVFAIAICHVCADSIRLILHSVRIFDRRTYGYIATYVRMDINNPEAMAIK